MNSGLRLLFDGYWWVNGPPSNRHVMRETVEEWLHQFPQDRLAIMTRRGDEGQVRTDTKGRVAVLGARLWPHGLSNVTELAAAARRWQPDAVYAQNYAPVVPGVLSVAFLHDVLFATHPQWFTRSERLYFAPMIPLAKRAGLIFTSSGTEAARIRTVTGADPVVPVGIGMSTELMRATPKVPTAVPESGRFLLAVGRLNVRKNLATAMAAALRSGVLSQQQPLLVVGSVDGKTEGLDDATAAAVDDGLIRFTGYVTDDELVWLYRHTALSIFLTRGEGYGMPAIESLYFGAPSLVSDIEVFREILPPSVPRVDPDDVEAAAGLIRQIVTEGNGESPELHRVPAWSDSVSAMRAAIVAALS